MASDFEEDEDEFDDVPDEEEDLDLVDEDDIDADEEDIIEDPKERAARSLKVRRAIEDRMEAKRLEDDLNYLDVDDD